MVSEKKTISRDYPSSNLEGEIVNRAGLCTKVIIYAMIVVNSELTSDTYFVVFNAGRKPAKVSRLGADPTWKMTWRLIR